MPAVGAWLAASPFAGWVALNFGIAGAVTAGVLMKTAFVVGVGLYSRRQQRKARASALDSIRDRAFMVRSAVATRPIAYGRCRLSGPFRPVGTHGSIGELFSFTVSLAGPLDAVEEVWFGDTSLGVLDASGHTTTGDYYKSRTEPTFKNVAVSTAATITLDHLAAAISNVSVPIGDSSWANMYLGDPSTDDMAYSSATVGGVTVLTFHSSRIGTAITVNYTYTSGEAKARALAFLGQSGQAADPYLLAQFPTIWTADHRSDGASYLSCTLAYDPDIYPTGIPNVSCIARAMRCYDPRTGLTVWTQNNALIARNYLKTEFECEDSEINDAAVIAAANACDEAVPLAGGGTQARYTFDGTLDSGVNRMDNLELITDAMAGGAVFSAGQWTMWAGVWREPTLALDEDDLADGPINVQAFMPRRDLFNGVRGVYTDPETWTQTDFPPYVSPTFVAQDGGEEVIQDIDLPMVTDAHRAQRIAKLLLYRSRQALTFSASWNLGAYEVTPGDSVEITIGRYGWTDKVFKCIDRDFDPMGRVQLTFQEDAEAIYSWSYSEATDPDPAPNTTLPSVRTVTAPTLTFGSGAQFATVLADGSVRPFLRVYWSAMDATVEDIELYWRRAHETVWQSDMLDAERLSYDIYGISSGETMIVQARSTNGLGVHSEWVVHSVDIDTESPANAGNILLGVGVNLFPNSRILTTSVPWTASHYSDAVGSTQTGTPGSDYGLITSYPDERIGWAADGTTYAEYRPVPYNAIVRVTTAGASYNFRATTNYVYPNGVRIPCKYLDIIEVSAFVGSVGGGAKIGCQFFDANGDSRGFYSGDVPALRARNISPTTVTTLLSSTESAYDGKVEISRFKRIYGWIIVPSNAVTAQVLIQTRREVAVGVSTVSIAMPYIGLAHSNQLTQPSQWSAGPA